MKGRASQGSKPLCSDPTESSNEHLVPHNGYAVQLRPTALTANAGAERSPPEQYHESIGTSCWVSAATAC